MFWDIAIVFGIGLSQLFVTIYAVWVSVTGNKIKIAFIIAAVGALGIALTVYAAIRNGRTQQRLEADITELRRGQQTANTGIEHIENKIPESRASVQIDGWEGPMIGPSKIIQLNATMKNHGDVPAIEGIGITGGKLIPMKNLKTRPSQLKEEEALWNQLVHTGKDQLGDISIGPDQHVTQVIGGADITEKRMQDIKNGKLVAFFVLIIRYKDVHSGLIRETRACEFYWGRDPQVLHRCYSGHNDMN